MPRNRERSPSSLREFMLKFNEAIVPVKTKIESLEDEIDMLSEQVRNTPNENERVALQDKGIALESLQQIYKDYMDNIVQIYEQTAAKGDPRLGLNVLIEIPKFFNEIINESKACIKRLNDERSLTTVVIDCVKNIANCFIYLINTMKDDKIGFFETTSAIPNTIKNSVKNIRDDFNAFVKEVGTEEAQHPGYSLP